MRYQGTRRGWYAVVGRNKRNLWEQIRSVSSCITPRISLKKERMSELATWHQSRIYPSDVFLLLPERPQDVPPVGMKRKLAFSTTAKRNRMHTVKLILITLHEIRYWFVFQMTIKRSLSRWLYLIPFPLCPPWIHGIWNDFRAYGVEICISNKQHKDSFFYLLFCICPCTISS